MSEIALGRYGDRILDPEVLKQMYQLRHTVFRERLGWDVVSDHGMEHDFFDVLNPVYLLAKGDKNEIEACWRLLPTMGPYMLRDVFPELLHGQPAPQDPVIWELSRFAVSKSSHKAACFGPGEISIRMFQTVARFALENGINQYVTVTTTAVERLMRKFGFNLHLFGPPVRVGITMAVAFWIDIDSHTEAIACGHLPSIRRAVA